MFSVILVFNTFFTYNCVKGQNLIKFTSRKGGYNANSRYYIRNPGRDCRSDPGDCVDRGSGKQKEARQAAQVARNTPFMEETAISAIAQGELPVVTGTPVLLEEGEVAHYYAPATKIVTKNKAVGRTGSGAGVRVRVAKGVSVRTRSRVSLWGWIVVLTIVTVGLFFSEHWRRFQSDGLRRSDRNLFRRYRFNE